MINYFIQTGVLFTLCWLFEKFVLNNDQSFNFRRTFLLFSLIFVPILPFLSFPSISAISTFYYPEVLIVPGTLINENVNGLTLENQFFSISNILLAIYLIGVLISMLFFLTGLYKIISSIRRSQKEVLLGYTLIKDSSSQDPYSFFRYINLGKFNPDTSEEKQTILGHELVHVRQWHSVDTIIASLLTIVFWFLPPIHFLKYRLQLIHEYIADEEASKMTSVKSYCQLLLKQTQRESRLHIANTFYFKPLKNRIMMMLNKNQIKNSITKKFLIIPFLAICLTTILISQSSNIEIPAAPQAPKQPAAAASPTPPAMLAPPSPSAPPAPSTQPSPPAPPTPPAPVAQNEIEEMPRFYSKECEKMSNTEQRNVCAQTKLIQFIYKSLKYPANARVNNIEGTVIVQFMVEKDGSISEIEVLKSPDEELAEAALEPINLMSKKGTFVPGKDKGEIVKAQLVLPIKFKLD